MPKRTYNEIPYQYPMCIQADCPRAASCLHQVAYGQASATDRHLLILNPAQCLKGEACSHYRDARPVTYARGFTRMQRHMTLEQYGRFSRRLMSVFGRNPYYERRRGTSALSPQEQLTVRKALRAVGVSDDQPFDSYEQTVNWYD
ncbi:MAG: DUF6078 family protein [Prevotella sp.]|nr:DUF6078 family protein [Prevotella sp.]